MDTVIEKEKNNDTTIRWHCYVRYLGKNCLKIILVNPLHGYITNCREERIMKEKEALQSQKNLTPRCLIWYSWAHSLCSKQYSVVMNWILFNTWSPPARGLLYLKTLTFLYRKKIEKNCRIIFLLLFLQG